MIFLNMPTQAPFLYSISVFSNTNFTEKTEGFSMIWTVGFKASTLTTWPQQPDQLCNEKIFSTTFKHFFRFLIPTVHLSSTISNLWLWIPKPVEIMEDSARRNSPTGLCNPFRTRATAAGKFSGNSILEVSCKTSSWATLMTRNCRWTLPD